MLVDFQCWRHNDNVEDELIVSKMWYIRNYVLYFTRGHPQETL